MDMIYKVILKRIDNIFMKIFSFSIINLVTKIKKIFIYTNYDSSEYWKKRAKEPGQAAVLWKNQEYNNLYRKLEFNLLKKFLPKTINEPFYILDIGCGIGIVSKFLVENYPLAYVDAVDFQEMIEIARQKISMKESITFQVKQKTILMNVKNMTLLFLQRVFQQYEISID